ncbi:MAG: hypothetical protein RLZZ127_1579 [Planctomycetota bacterium]|jgi:hypothetical protein
MPIEICVRPLPRHLLLAGWVWRAARAARIPATFRILTDPDQVGAWVHGSAAVPDQRVLVGPVPESLRGSVLHVPTEDPDQAVRLARQTLESLGIQRSAQDRRNDDAFIGDFDRRVAAFAAWLEALGTVHGWSLRRGRLLPAMVVAASTPADRIQAFLKDWRTLPFDQLFAIRERSLSEFGFDPDADWGTDLIEALEAWVDRPDERLWHHHVPGQCRTSVILREQCQAADRAAQAGTPVVLVGHDATTAQHLAGILDARAPGAEIRVVDPRDEDDAYRLPDTVVVDVPPLHERLYDLPVIAHAHLCRLADTEVDLRRILLPQDMAWMQQVGWRDLTALSTWLRRAVRCGADLAVPQPWLPGLPGIRSAAEWPEGLPYDEGAIRAQQIRWRMGRSTSQAEAVRGFWSEKNLKEWLTVAVPARPGEIARTAGRARADKERQRSRRAGVAVQAPRTKPLRLPPAALRW